MSRPANADRTGLLLFAHGARDPRWAEPFEAVRAQAAALRPEADVRLAFLEFMTPDLATAGAALAAAGCARVEIVPVFLGAGGHVRKDVPVLLEALRAAHPAVDWRLAATVGEDPRVIDAIAAAAVDARPANADPGAR